MTREEMIENLKGLLESNYVDSFDDAENEALDMAIQALSQEPCDDVVSRKPNCIDCIHKSVCFRLDMRVDSDYAEKCGDFLPSYLPSRISRGMWQ